MSIPWLIFEDNDLYWYVIRFITTKKNTTKTDLFLFISAVIINSWVNMVIVIQRYVNFILGFIMFFKNKKTDALATTLLNFNNLIKFEGISNNLTLSHDGEATMFRVQRKPKKNHSSASTAMYASTCNKSAAVWQSVCATI